MTGRPGPEGAASAAETEWLTVEAGGRWVHLAAPRLPAPDPEDRILLWWGVTRAALALARRISSEPPEQGGRALELGCGLGLAGIAAALVGYRVVFSDLTPEALQRAQWGAIRSGVPTERVSTWALDWERPEATRPREDGAQSPATGSRECGYGGVADTAGAPKRFDLILGAEILYDYDRHDALLELMPSLLAPAGRLLLADRPRLVVDRFLGRLRGRGFRGERSDVTLALPGESPRPVSVWDWRERTGDT